MSKPTQIYIALLNEGVDVWRAVQAEHEADNVYRILSQPYDRLTESWQFEPGDVVRCEIVESHEGPILAATQNVPDGPFRSPRRANIQ